MEFDPDNGKPVPPDSRVSGFGDSAIVIRDFNEFLIRFGRAIINMFEYSIEFADRINYFELYDNRQLIPLFEKVSSFSYQKELRLALAQTVKVDDSYRVLFVSDNIKLNIGDIRDIAYLIPIDDFLDLSGIYGHFVCPSNNDREHPSLFDKMVNDTRVQMMNYKVTYTRPLITIG